MYWVIHVLYTFVFFCAQYTICTMYINLIERTISILRFGDQICFWCCCCIICARETIYRMQEQFPVMLHLPVRWRIHDNNFVTFTYLRGNFRLECNLVYIFPMWQKFLFLAVALLCLLKYGKASYLLSIRSSVTCETGTHLNLRLLKFQIRKSAILSQT